LHFAAETNPLQDNHLQHTKARFLRYKLQARRKSWRNKTASLNLEKDANKFADNYEVVSNIPVTRQHQGEARREQRERKTHQTTNECMNKKLTLNELQAALKTAKGKEISRPRCNHK